MNTVSDVIRHGDAIALAQALQDSRRDTLATFAAYAQALAHTHTPLSVPCSPELNPPLWELGHIAWFQRWWNGRNPQRRRGVDADPFAPRTPARDHGADHWFDSSRVPHTDRWALPLPSANELLDEAALVLQETLQLLEAVAASPTVRDQDLYFFRLALAHEDMHHEAAVYMAQTLGIALPGPQGPKRHTGAARESLRVQGGPFRLGHAGPGFWFDNEAGPHTLALTDFDIDSRVVSWLDYLPFIEAGGYQDARFWTPPGQQWLQQQNARAPRYLRQQGSSPSGWQVQRFGQWQDLALADPACHISAFEAQAWCRWAGRRLPSEAEWECAASTLAEGFDWGEVWEWTDSPFTPYPGFVAHPYRDYSAPWFGTRQVLRGASFATHARMRHVRYRNFYTPARNDIFAGFRSCAR